MIFDEQVSQRDGCARSMLSEGEACLQGGGWNPDRELHTEAGVCPGKHIPGEPVVDELTLDEQADNGGAEILVELCEIARGLSQVSDLVPPERHMNERSLSIKAAFQKGSVEVGIPPNRVSR